MKTYFSRLFVTLDILINVLIGGKIETLSSRMGRAIQEGRNCLLCKLLCGLLDLRWKDHCVNNIMEPKG
jgi:hypothetical protein